MRNEISESLACIRKAIDDASEGTNFKPGVTTVKVKVEIPASEDVPSYDAKISFEFETLVVSKHFARSHNKPEGTKNKRKSD